MLIKNIHHIAIIASDYQRSKDFYTNVLQLEVIQETYRQERRSYKLDLKVTEQSQIELFSFPDPPPRVSNPEACGLRHLAFEVPDIDFATAYLAGHQVKCEPIRVDEITGQRFTFFRDPDGLPLELYERVAAP